MITPPPLQPGARVGIAAPARSIEARRLEAAEKSLREWGFEPVRGKRLFHTDHQFAGSDADRTADLQEMLDDPSLSAILFARGGYGTLRILDAFDLKSLRKHPKWLIGFSDLTALLMRCFNEGIQSIHGPMAVSWDGKTGDAASFEWMRKMLTGASVKYIAPVQRPDLVRTGLGEGKLIGGNLSMLSQLLGTPTDFNAKGCVLFLEDLDEYLYHIDRMMVHLKRGGKLEHLAGLIVGGFTSLRDNETPFGKTAEEIILDAVKDYDFPVCFGFPTGHWPQNYPLIVGSEVKLGVSHAGCELTFVKK